MSIESGTSSTSAEIAPAAGGAPGERRLVIAGQLACLLPTDFAVTAFETLAGLSLGVIRNPLGLGP